jgi:hypothetical protein
MARFGKNASGSCQTRGFNVNAEALPELWAEHLNAVRERVRKSYDFPISDVLPYGYTIELEILEFNGTGVAPID